jgi:predicted phage-related endonuclease
MIGNVVVRHGLNLVSTLGMPRETWLLNRQDGIGGSDISSILGLNHRFSAVELFYQKVGLTPSSSEENEAMFWGSRNEDTILNIGQYYDFQSGEYVDNYNAGNKLRKISKIRYMVNNPQYPWIIGNLDGAVNFTGRNFRMDGPAEAKAISRQTAEMWENGIPPYHIIQVTTYCIVCEPMMNGNEACIFYLEDGNKFRGYKIPVVESVKEQILIQSEAFWKKVVQGREIMANVKGYDNQLKFLAEIEPAPDSTPAYYEFLSELFKRKQSFVRIDGSDADKANALAYKQLGEQMNTLDDERQVYKNKIMKSLHDAGANIIDFGEDGKITYNKKLYVNVNA